MTDKTTNTEQNDIESLAPKLAAHRIEQDRARLARLRWLESQTEERAGLPVDDPLRVSRFPYTREYQSNGAQGDRYLHAEMRATGSVIEHTIQFRDGRVTRYAYTHLHCTQHGGEMDVSLHTERPDNLPDYVRVQHKFVSPSGVNLDRNVYLSIDQARQVARQLLGLGLLELPCEQCGQTDEHAEGCPVDRADPFVTEGS